MKKLLLFLFVIQFGYSQEGIEIRLVNPNVGYAVIYNEFLPNQYHASNDAGLNSILSNYGYPIYEEKVAHPYPPFEGRIMRVYSTSNQLFADLQAYSSVIEVVRFSDYTIFSDAASLELLNADIGVPTGFDTNNIVLTNDDDLNTIFQNHNVFYYEKMFPSITTGVLAKVYSLVCNCEVNALIADLDNYESVIEYAENYTSAILSNNEILKEQKVVVSPNPFSTVLTIQANEAITTYSLNDLSGKELVATTSKSVLDAVCSHLNSGVYFLNLQFENGSAGNYKIVKK